MNGEAVFKISEKSPVEERKEARDSGMQCLKSGNKEGAVLAFRRAMIANIHIMGTPRSLGGRP
ncbi:hypothetical protein GS501_00190 [Saccharibacter sp. 17.LH.SD]|uniref:hypothetical protein n=1 Tax=Saccharibacter sp. 17.LH.SD TaxID=2689393 RepID=UPI00136B08E2|nr:hypothetical protein [Saccharibacter sp. 17.LH.SD]MXV43500.1 hypothetical protein [Saccharibacter sp. 17.LH.SD]